MAKNPCEGSGKPAKRQLLLGGGAHQDMSHINIKVIMSTLVQIQLFLVTLTPQICVELYLSLDCIVIYCSNIIP